MKKKRTTWLGEQGQGIFWPASKRWVEKRWWGMRIFRLTSVVLTDALRSLIDRLRESNGKP